MQQYSLLLAKALNVSLEDREIIRKGALLHDIGKISIPDAILFKQGLLSEQEWEVMRSHPIRGEEICRPMKSLWPVLPIIRNHHERWDGSGYPAHLKGEEIPLSARIVAVADVYDALRSARPYKPGFSHEETCRIILEGDERIDPRAHFDPQVLAVFAASRDEMARIWSSLQDGPVTS